MCFVCSLLDHSASFIRGILAIPTLLCGCRSRSCALDWLVIVEGTTELLSILGRATFLTTAFADKSIRRARRPPLPFRGRGAASNPGRDAPRPSLAPIDTTRRGYQIFRVRLPSPVPWCPCVPASMSCMLPFAKYTCTGRPPAGRTATCFSVRCMHAPPSAAFSERAKRRSSRENDERRNLWCPNDYHVWSRRHKILSFSFVSHGSSTQALNVRYDLTLQYACRFLLRIIGSRISLYILPKTNTTINTEKGSKTVMCFFSRSTVKYTFVRFHLRTTTPRAYLKITR